jgi:hypothetical protein
MATTKSSKSNSYSYSDSLAETARVGALKLKPAAEYLGGLSIPTMHRLIQRGLLRPNRSLRHLIFSHEELDRFLRAGQ